MSAIIGALAAGWTVKNVGRKRMLMIGHIGMGLSLLIVAGGYLLNQSMICLVFMCLFTICF